jgi:heme/copper-type cytochrome/quinol oxidase subunit 3
VLALGFFGLAASALAAALMLGLAFLHVWPATSFPAARFPPVFACSTAALLGGSLCLSHAVAAVRRERQVRFRAALTGGLVCGVLFVALQTAALSWLIRRQPPEEASTGVGAFVAVFAALHALHFVVALLFLSFVAVQAWAQRYDHEYYWGVTVCTWFWHALGIAWLAVLAVMLIAAV